MEASIWNRFIRTPSSEQFENISESMATAVGDFQTVRDEATGKYFKCLQYCLYKNNILIKAIDITFV